MSASAAPGSLAVTLQDQFDLALLFRRIATVERDAPTVTDVDQLRWTGPAPEFRAIAEMLEAPNLAARAERLATREQSRG